MNRLNLLQKAEIVNLQPYSYHGTSMAYKTAEILAPKLNEIMTQFIDNYISKEIQIGHINFNNTNEFNAQFSILVEKIIYAESLLVQEDFLPIVELNISHNIPYIIVVNELNYIKNIFIHRLLEVKATKEIIFLCDLFNNLLRDIATIYLERYIKALQSRNKIRLISLSYLEKGLIYYYESHIKWLDQLAQAMEHKDCSKMPELDSCKCIFGKWLEDKGKLSISNNSKFNEINKLHQTLHFVAFKIENMINKNDCDCHAGMTYLEKAEFISLEIGTELTIIDNKIIMTRAKKDPLTGVLNRSLLEQLFHDQFEIALVTQQSFVLAMCDLDHFKAVNDTYGHNEGDNILKLFSKILKQNIRGSDLIFRYGGDEFIILFPASKKDQVKKLLNKVRIEFQKNIDQNDSYENNITVSMGTLEVIPSDSDLNEKEPFQYYLEQVDKKLYSAKDNGRNRVE